MSSTPVIIHFVLQILLGMELQQTQAERENIRRIYMRQDQPS